MTKLVYPILIDKEYMKVVVPDFSNLVVQGPITVDGLLQKTREVLGENIILRERTKTVMPEPSKLEDFIREYGDSGKAIFMLEMDMEEYRRKHDMQTIRKTVTIPNYLNEAGIRAGVNFSAILTQGLKDSLGIKI